MSVQTMDKTQIDNSKLKELVIPVTGMHCANCANTVARNLKQDTSLDQLSDCVDQSLAASLPLNPANILRGRYTRLLESQLPDWLKTASDSQKTQWRLAVERLNHERLAAESDDAQPLSEIGRKHTLLGYARLQLQQQIKKDHGIDVDPDEIFISTTEALRTGPLINPVSGSGFPAGMSLGRTGPIISYHTTRRSLSELALSNVGIWDVTFALTAQVKDGAGQKHAVLTSSYLKTLVRQLDIGERYKKNLKELLVNSSQAQWRKERYVAFKQAQLNLDLLEATLAGALTTQQVSWVRAALEQPVENNRAQINGEQVKVHLLMLRYKPLPGLLVFSATGSGQPRARNAWASSQASKAPRLWPNKASSTPNVIWDIGGPANYISIEEWVRKNGADTICFSADLAYAGDATAKPRLLGQIERAGVSDAVKAGILGGNLRRLFRLTKS